MGLVSQAVRTPGFTSFHERCTVRNKTRKSKDKNRNNNKTKDDYSRKANLGPLLRPPTRGASLMHRAGLTQGAPTPRSTGRVLSVTPQSKAQRGNSPESKTAYVRLLHIKKN